MFSIIRKRVTYANVAVTFALVFAMSGGAYAAGKYLISSTKQISPKVLKSLVGKTGPAGKNGTNGTNGAPGEKGAQGPQGPQGSQGPEGKEGKAGEPGKEGKAGANGTTGFTETLPPEKIETGTWGFDAKASGDEAVPISFPIPLRAALAETQVHYINDEGKEITFPEPTKKLVFTGETKVEGPPSGCPGSVAEPTAEPGNLCVYGTLAGERLSNFPFHNPENGNAENPGAEEAGTAGTVLYFNVETNDIGTGTWAVNAPKEN